MNTIDSNIFYPCEICPKQFKSKIFLRRHAKRTHEKIPVICGQCNLPFARRDSLKRHERNVHARENFENLKREGLLVDIPGIFMLHECIVCGQKYKLKDMLKRHIFDRHINSERLKCAHCSAEFRRKTHLVAHLHNKHNDSKLRSQITNYPCLLCGTKFKAVLAAREHYTQAHQIILLNEKLKFDSVNRFIDWKMSLEASTVCRYVPENESNYDEFSRTLYRCHKSNREMLENDGFNLRSYNSTKWNGFCPAEITLTVKHEDDTCLVSFWKTHVGHPISHENSNIRLCLREEEEKRMDHDGENELDPLTDLRDIFKTYHATQSVYDPSKDHFNIEKFVKRHSDSIVYCKRASEPDTTYEILKDDDLVLIVIGEEQSKMLQQYAHKVVVLDCAHGTKPTYFSLHSLMVVDDDGWEIAVAFMLTSSNDQSVIDIFLTFVLDAYGSPIYTSCLMTNMLREIYYSSWKKIMSEPKFRLMCSWRVVEAWKQNLPLIHDSEQRELVHHKLRELINEANKMKFEETLEALLTDTNPNTETFLDYFKANFSDCVDNWAFCFRQRSRIGSLIRAKAFNDLVEFVLANGDNFQSLAHCLYRLDKYMTLKFYDRATSPGLKKLKERHRTALAHFGHATVTAGDEKNEWLVSSCREKGENETVMEMFVVQERVPKECGDSDGECSLLCVECVSCVHEFVCSCSDAAIEGNMCEHIHALCLYLRTSIVEHSEDISNIAPGEDTDDVTSDWLSERRCSLFSVVELKAENNAKNSLLNERKRSTLEKCARLINSACSEEAMDTIDDVVASIEPILRRISAN